MAWSAEAWSVSVVASSSPRAQGPLTLPFPPSTLFAIRLLPILKLHTDRFFLPSQGYTAGSSPRRARCRRGRPAGELRHHNNVLHSNTSGAFGEDSSTALYRVETFSTRPRVSSCCLSTAKMSSRPTSARPCPSHLAGTNTTTQPPHSQPTYSPRTAGSLSTLRGDHTVPTDAYGGHMRTSGDLGVWPTGPALAPGSRRQQQNLREELWDERGGGISFGGDSASTLAPRSPSSLLFCSLTACMRGGPTA